MLKLKIFKIKKYQEMLIIKAKKKKFSEIDENDIEVESELKLD